MMGASFQLHPPLVLQYHAANFSGQVDFCIFGVVFGIFYDISSWPNLAPICNQIWHQIVSPGFDPPFPEKIID